MKREAGNDGCEKIIIIALMTISWSWWQQWKWVLIGVMAVTVLAYGNCLGNELVWDDVAFVYEWDAIGQPWRNLPKYVTGELIESWVAPNYRPVKNFIYSLNWEWWGEWVGGYHLVAMVMQVVASWLVVGVVYEVGGNKVAAMVAGMVFGVHPVHVEAVSWITASMDSWGSVWYLATVWWYLRPGKKQMLEWVAIYILAGLAFLTNEVSFSLPIMWVFVDWWRGDVAKRGWGKTGKRVAPLVVMLCGYMVIRWMVLGWTEPRQPVWQSYWMTGLVMLVVVTKYLWLMIWPVGLSVNHKILESISASYYVDFDYSRAEKFGWWQGEIVSAALVWLGLTVLVWKLKGKFPWLVWVWGWWWIGLLPVLQIVPTTFLMAERYAYLASVAWAMLVGMGVGEGEKRWKKVGERRLIWGLAAVMIGGYGWLTWQRNMDWRNEERLWERAAEENPGSAMVWNNWGKSVYEAGRRGEGKEKLEKAVGLNPNYVIGLVNLGAVYLNENRVTEAKDLLEKAVEFKPDYQKGREYLVQVYLKQEDREGAMMKLERWVNEEKVSAEEKLELAAMYHQMLIYNQAERYYLEALKQDSDMVKGWQCLSQLYLDWGRNSEAIESLGKVLGLDPDNATAASELEKVVTRSQ